MEEWILLAMAPVFLGFILWEAWYWHGKRPVYSLKDSVSNAALALMHQMADAVAWALVIGLFWWVYQYRLFELPTTWWTIAAASDVAQPIAARIAVLVSRLMCSSSPR